MHDEKKLLIQALARLSQTGASDAVEARGLIAALGRWAASGAEPPEVPANAVPALLRAGRDVAAELAAETPRLASLDDRWHAEKTQADADAVASAPLAAHLEAFLVLEGIESIIDSMPGDTTSAEEVAQTLAAAIAAYDTGLLRNLDCLSTLTDGDTIKAWRRSLPSGLGPLLWWLDGSLEAHSAACAQRTADLAGRLASAFAGRPVVPAPRVLASKAAARAITAAAEYQMAAAPSAAAGMTNHAWRHPSHPLEAVLWVPAKFDAAADLRIVFRGTGGGAERNLVGEVMFLGGMPAVVREEGDGAHPRCEATWPAREVAATIRNAVTLVDCQGEHWIPTE